MHFEILLKPILNYSNMATATEFLKYKKNTYHCLKADDHFFVYKGSQKQAI